MWQIALGVLLAVNVCSLTFSKLATDILPKKKSLGIFWQSFFCISIAALYVLFSDNFLLDPILFFVTLVGLSTVFGTYCQWQAFALSFSRSSLFFPLMDVWAIFLALLFLKEVSFWNIQLILGAGLCFAAMWLFQVSAKRKTEEIREDNNTRKKWFFFAIGMIATSGTAAFLLKVFSATVSRGSFLISFYLGTFLGSMLILLLEKQNPFKVHLPKKTLLTILILSTLVMGATLALYWTYQLGGPVSLVLPVRGLTITVIPILIGWTIFKERKTLGKKELLAFVIGFIGVILILLK